MMKHDTLSQEYDPGTPGVEEESEELYKGTLLKNTSSKSKSASPTVTYRPAVLRKKDRTVMYS
jgi:hypothetical protein